MLRSEIREKSLRGLFSKKYSPGNKRPGSVIKADFPWVPCGSGLRPRPHGFLSLAGFRPARRERWK